MKVYITMIKVCVDYQGCEDKIDMVFDTADKARQRIKNLYSNSVKYDTDYHYDTFDVK